MRKDSVWLAPPWGLGEPREVEATPEVLVPLLNQGWAQCAPPVRSEEVTEHVRD